uniref:Movement protein TGB2 n=1 Tax=Garlic common latent virus TaxID=47900 RepID=A0A6M2YTG5_9VIRU|nr:TGB2 [Garlic common latent virus]QED43229.1 TGB2 [Garlic common latent virus]
MPLLPPPDNTKAILAVAIGCGVGLVLFVLTRSTLPHVGDNLHSLPHGGSYRDGTKSINYCGPRKTYPSSNLFANSASLVPIVVVVLTGVIILFSRNNSRCVACGRTHA